MSGRTLTGPIGIAAVVGALTTAAASEALADGCRVTVQASAGLSLAWRAAVTDLEREVARDVAGDCEPVDLAVLPASDGVRVVGVRPDGRRTERLVTRPSALVPTALGLVVAIPAEPSAVDASDAAPAAAEASPAGASPVEAPHADPLSRDVAPLLPLAPGERLFARDRRMTAWLGVSVGARMGQPSAVAMADVEGQVDLVMDHWILAGVFRYVPLGDPAALHFDGDEYREVALGLGAGRRLDLGSTALDAVITPSLVAMNMERDMTEDGKHLDVEQSAVQFRLDGSLRWAVPTSATWRLTVTTDLDVAPADLATPMQIDHRLPAFPTWTAGLRFGGTGTLL